MTDTPAASPGDGLLTVIATIRETPPDHTGTHTLARDEIRAEATSYEEGREMLLRQVPEGWQVTSWRVDRPDE